jgi:hypothetical protein
VALVTGDPAGSVNTGNVAVRLVDAAAPLTLGTVNGRGLVSWTRRTAPSRRSRDG